MEQALHNILKYIQTQYKKVIFTNVELYFAKKNGIKKDLPRNTYLSSEVDVH
jgi:hypothetical protein